MSQNLIESTARKLRSGITGVLSPDELAAKQDARGSELIKNLATGGLAIGGGAGALVALVNYLKSMKQENELDDQSRLNDDTLYIPAINKAAATEGGVNRWLAPGLAVSGGILSAGGAYALTQAVYNYLQKKKRHSMLDEAQGEAIAMVDKEVEKSAAKMNFYDLVTAFPVAVPLLAALASGGVAYAALNKTFPTVKKTKSKFPKRVRQVSATGVVSPMDEDEDVVKTAALHMRQESDIEDAAYEFLLMTVAQMGHEKSANYCITADLLHKAASDGITGIEQTLKDGGIPAVEELTKQASSEKLDVPNMALAAAMICKSARLRPIAAAIAAAEFQEMAPSLYGQVLGHDEESLEKFAGVASLMQLSFFRPQILEKSATLNPNFMELASLTDQQPGIPSFESALTSDVNGSMTDDAEGEDYAGDELDTEDTDPVDAFLTDEGNKSPVLEGDEDIAAQEAAEETGGNDGAGGVIRT